MARLLCLKITSLFKKDRNAKILFLCEGIQAAKIEGAETNDSLKQFRAKFDDKEEGK